MESVLEKYLEKYKGQLLLTVLVVAVLGAATLWLGIYFWDFIKANVVLYSLVKIVVILVPLMLGVAYLTYAERKIIGYMQVRIGPNRVGPRGWLQPIADALKLLMKEIVVLIHLPRRLRIEGPEIAPRETGVVRRDERGPEEGVRRIPVGVRGVP